eukprot:SAG31_NODE_6588_length_1961_cov_2.769603_2_plen_160_part_00
MHGRARSVRTRVRDTVRVRVHSSSVHQALAKGSFYLEKSALGTNPEMDAPLPKQSSAGSQLHARAVVVILGFNRDITNPSAPSSALMNRIRSGVAVYRQLGADRKVLMMTGGDAQKFGLGTEADLMQQKAVELGVPVDEIIKEDEARYTIENGCDQQHD